MSDKAVITCALNGVLTDPKQHNVPVLFRGPFPPKMNPGAPFGPFPPAFWNCCRNSSWTGPRAIRRVLHATP